MITTKGNADKSPSVTLIYPNTELKKFAELSDVDINDMVLFHKNDNHFNLVVNKDSDLATLGSLSYHYDFGPMLVNNDEPDKKHEKENVTPKKDAESGIDDDSKLLNLQKEFKTCRN